MNNGRTRGRGGGNDQNAILVEDDEDATGITENNFDQPRSVIAGMKLPSEYTKQHLECVRIFDGTNKLVSNPLELKFVPSISDISGGLNYLKEVNTDTTSYGLRTADGNVFTEKALNSLKKMSSLRIIANEVREEKKWLERVKRGFKCPKSANVKEDLIKSAEAFISLIQRDNADKELHKPNLRISQLKDVIGTRLMTDGLMSWLINKVNKTNLGNAFCVSYCEEYRGDTWSDECVERFNDDYDDSKPPKCLIVILNVGKRDDGKVFIGFDNDGKKSYFPCHYSLLVYDFEEATAWYGDSLGWKKPDIIDRHISDLVNLLVSQKVTITSKEVHCTVRIV